MMRMTIFFFGLFSQILFAGRLIAAPLVTPRPDPKAVLSAKAELRPARVAPGAQAQLLIKLALAKGHHAYVERFKLKALEQDFFTVAAIQIEPQVKFFDPVSKKHLPGVENEASLAAIVEISERAPIGVATATLSLTYQACTNDYCLLPQTLSLPLALEVLATPAEATSKVEKAKPVASLTALSSSGAEGLFGKSWFATFVIVFGMGILTSLTPCIYPMIPITLAVIGSRRSLPKNFEGARSSAWRGFFLSSIYVLGIALTYALLGLFVARTGALFGSVMSSAWTVGSISILFILMGASMYGAFTIEAPAFVRQSVGSWRIGSAGGQDGSGAWGAFATGLVAGLVASPCVGPVLVAVLAFIAQTQNPLLGFALLFTFALGMGLLLIVVGSFSHLLDYLPRSGPWLEAIKFVFGSIMIAMGIYYLSLIAPRWLVYFAAALCSAGVAAFYGALKPGKQMSPLAHWQRLFSLGSFVASCLVAVGMLGWAGLNNFKNPPLLSQNSPRPEGLKWQAFSEQHLSQAKSSGKPVILDFGASWCAACVELEEKTYIDQSVKSLAQRFVLLKVDATESSDHVRATSQQFGVLGLPTVLFLDARGEVISELTLLGFEQPAEFVKRMNRALEKVASVGS